MPEASHPGSTEETQGTSEISAEAVQRLQLALEREVPELVAGKLPNYLEARLARYGDARHPTPPYALGVNQSALFSMEEVEHFFSQGGLRQNGGLAGQIESVAKRFVVMWRIGHSGSLTPPNVDRDAYIERLRSQNQQTLAVGYTGRPDNYKLVYAFPLLGEDRGDPVNRTPERVINEPYGYGQNNDGSPDGVIYVTRHNSDGSVRGIYNNRVWCAGVIDGEGHFTPNADFGLRDGFTPTTAEDMRRELKASLDE